ncbi:MAG: DUF3047 domain-containing protein [Gemmatimonadota bacterium]
MVPRPILLGMLALLVHPLAAEAQAPVNVRVEGADRAGMLAPPWHVVVEEGDPDVRVGGGGESVTLTCTDASYGVERPLDLDPGRLPMVSWAWRVEGPDVAPVRLSVVVLFDRPGLGRRALAYAWGPRGQPGEVGRATRGFAMRRVETRSVTVRSPDAAGSWRAYARDLRADHEDAFGTSPDEIVGIRFQIACLDARGSVRGTFRNVRFGPPGGGR